MLNLTVHIADNCFIFLLFPGFLSTYHCRLAPANSSEPPKFTPPPKPVIIDKTQTAASLRKYVSL